MTTVDKIKAKFEALRVSLHERARREWVGAEARALGHGGVKLVHEATGIAPTTISKGKVCARWTPLLIAAGATRRAADVEAGQPAA